MLSYKKEILLTLCDLHPVFRPGPCRVFHLFSFLCLGFILFWLSSFCVLCPILLVSLDYAHYCLCPWIMPNIACVPGLLCPILPVSMDYPLLPVSLDYAQYCLCPWIMPNIACVPRLCPILPMSLGYAQYCLFPWIMPNIACVPGLLCPILPVSMDYPLLPVSLDYAQYCLCPWIMSNIACVPGLCPILPMSLDYAQYCLFPWIMPNIAYVPGLCPILPVSLDYAQYCLCPWIIHYWLPLLFSLTYFLCLSFLIPFLKCTQSYNASSNTHLSHWLQCLWYDVLIRSPIDKCALDGHAIFVLYTSRLICMSYNITIFHIFSGFCKWSCKLWCRYEFTSIRCIFVEIQSLIRCYNCLI